MRSVGGSSIVIYMMIQGGRGMWWFGVCGLNETYLIYFLVLVFSPGVSRF